MRHSSGLLGSPCMQYIVFCRQNTHRHRNKIGKEKRNSDIDKREGGPGKVEAVVRMMIPQAKESRGGKKEPCIRGLPLGA